MPLKAPNRQKYNPETARIMNPIGRGAAWLAPVRTLTPATTPTINTPQDTTLKTTAKTWSPLYRFSIGWVPFRLALRLGGGPD